MPEAARYFIRAVVLVACLMLVAMAAPRMPAVVVALVLVAFAVVSTCGALYHVVVWRLHKQYKLAAGGTLSHYNRRWPLWLFGYMVVSLASGFLFMLEAPKWDGLEWLLIWAAIPIYYGVYKCVESFLRKEYAPEFYKSRAMVVSFWAVGILLCLAYALLSSAMPGPEYANLQAAFDATPRHYADSPSALMCDLDKLTSFTDGLTSYGMLEIEGASYVVGLACRFVVYAAVFFGLVNQFGFCLLTRREIESEFELLPARDEDYEGLREGKRFQWTYAAVAAGVALVAVVVMLCFEAAAQDAKDSEEQTAIEAFIDEQMAIAVHVVDGGYERVKSLDETKAQMRDELTPLVNDYFDQCKDNVGDYVAWRTSPLGMLSNWAERGKAREKFKEKITANVSDSDIERVYGDYQKQIFGIEGLMASGDSDQGEDGGNEADGSASGGGGTGGQVRIGWINLWEVLNNLQYADQVNELFASEDDLEGKTDAVIELARETTLAKLG